MAKTVRELWQTSGKTVHLMEWLEDGGLLWFRGKIYVVRGPLTHNPRAPLYCLPT